VPGDTPERKILALVNKVEVGGCGCAIVVNGSVPYRKCNATREFGVVELFRSAVPCFGVLGAGLMQERWAAGGGTDGP